MKKCKTFLKIFLVKLFFTLYKPFKKKPAQSKNVLVISTTGLGDTLWATPAIKALKENEPDTKIFVLTHKTGKKILENSPYIDEFIIWDKSFFSLLYLRKIPFSKVFVFHASQRIIFILLGFLCAKKIIGQEKINKGMDFLFTDLVKKTNIHEVKRRFEQINHFQKKPSLDFFLTQEEKAKAKLYLLSLNIDLKKPLILIHPGAKDRYRCYPIERLSKVAQELQKKTPTQFIITGSSDEKDLTIPLYKSIKDAGIPDTFMLPSLSIREFAAIMHSVDLVFTNDTGPMHLACSVDVPLIAFFSPSNPRIKGPISNKAHVLFKERSCKTCYERKCLEPFCLYQISPHVIVTKSFHILQSKYAAKNSHHLSQL